MFPRLTRFQAAIQLNTLSGRKADAPHAVEQSTAGARKQMWYNSSGAEQLPKRPRKKQTVWYDRDDPAGRAVAKDHALKMWYNRSITHRYCCQRPRKWNNSHRC